jgi:hypothetical protein
MILHRICYASATYSPSRVGQWLRDSPVQVFVASIFAKNTVTWSSQEDWSRALQETLVQLRCQRADDMVMLMLPYAADFSVDNEQKSGS